MASDYDGVGYAGSPLDTIGDPLNSVRPIQDYLTYKGDTPNTNFLSVLNQDAFRIIQGNLGTVTGDDAVRNFIRLAYENRAFPSTLEEMIVDLRVFTYAQYKNGLSFSSQLIIPGITANMTTQEKMDVARAWLQANRPNELDYTWSSNPGAPILETILNNFASALGISSENWTITNNNVTQPFNSFTATEQIAYLEELFKDNYAEYVSRDIPELPDDAPFQPGARLQAQWQAGFNAFVRRIVVVNEASINAVSRLSYESFYEAFFQNTAQSGNFDQFFAEFVKKIYGDPTLLPNGVEGDEGYFVPTLVFDKFTQEVLTQYLRTIGGSSPLGPSGSDAGSAKTRVLNRIFSLLVLLIEALQKVAAAQSDRLTIFSQWQKAYTDLQNEIRYVTDGDDRFNTDLSNNDGQRTDFNSQNATYTEIIKANKSVIGDDAKNLQTQINQSTDAVNQQASMATSILQQLAAIFSSIYR